jgi:NitT/TauT family transport system ATP-binding protein
LCHCPGYGTKARPVTAPLPSLDVNIRRKTFAGIAGQPPRPVLADIAFACGSGTFTAVTGPSGVGKTTLLNLLAGFDRAFEGSIAWPPATRLAYVFQEPRLLPWRTVEENVRLALRAVPSGDAPGWLDELFAAAGLADARDVYPTRLSLGMARRAGLVRAFAVRPNLLLMDEPFVSLDEPTAERLRDLLAMLLGRHPATVLFVTHNLREAVRLAGRLLVLAGRPARLVDDVPLDLAAAARRDRVAVELRVREIEARLMLDGIMASP